MVDMYEYHKKHNTDVTIAAKKMTHFDRYGVMKIEQGRVVGFVEKQPTIRWFINGGIYCINGIVWLGTPRKFSFEYDFLLNNIDELSIRVFVSNRDFIDIDIPADYIRAKQYFRRHIYV